MMILTMPWHWVGLLGMPRRMAYFDFSNSALDGQGWTLVAGSSAGSCWWCPPCSSSSSWRARGATEAEPAPFTFSTPVHMPATTPVALERLRPLGRDDDRAHGRQLRLSHRPARVAEGDVRACHLRRGPMMPERAAVRMEQSLVPLERRRGLVVLTLGYPPRRLCLAALGARRLHRQGHLGQHLPGRGRAQRMAQFRRRTRPNAEPRTTNVVLTSDMARSGGERRDRSRRDHRHPAVQHVPRRARHERGRRAEPGRTVSGGRHQAASGLQARRPLQRHHAEPCPKALGSGHPRHRVLLRLAAQGDARLRCGATTPALPALVRVGDPLRNIVPCMACHGGIDHKLGAPWLEGMPKAYLLSEMQGLRVRREAQRQLRPDAQHGASADAAGARQRRGVLCAARAGNRLSLTNAIECVSRNWRHIYQRTCSCTPHVGAACRKAPCTGEYELLPK